MEAINLLGSTMGLGLVSGLNLYATVLTVGLGLRLGLITLTPETSGLAVLSNPYVFDRGGRDLSDRVFRRQNSVGR